MAEGSSESGSGSSAGGDSNGGTAGSTVQIEVVHGALPRPPEAAVPEHTLPVCSTHLSPQAPGMALVQGGAEADVDNDVEQAGAECGASLDLGNVGTVGHDTKFGCNTEGHGDIVEQDTVAGCNVEAGLVGTDEHDTKIGCESGAGGCRLACDGATRPSGGTCGRWADEETSDSEGNSRAAGSGSRASQRQLVAAGGKVTTEGSVQRLIDDIRVAVARFRNDAESRRMVHEAKAALTPLIGKRRKSAKDRDCILRWQKNLIGLREAIEKMK